MGDLEALGRYDVDREVVDLTDAGREKALYSARMRDEACKKKGSERRIDQSAGRSLKDNVLGEEGALAFAIFRGAPWTEAKGQRDFTDVDGFEVRTRGEREDLMHVYLHEPMTKRAVPFAFVVRLPAKNSPPTFRVVGWCWGRDVPELGVIIDKLRDGRKARLYNVPQSKFQPFFPATPCSLRNYIRADEADAVIIRLNGGGPATGEGMPPREPGAEPEWAKQPPPTPRPKSGGLATMEDGTQYDPETGRILEGHRAKIEPATREWIDEQLKKIRKGLQ